MNIVLTMGACVGAGIIVRVLRRWQRAGWLATLGSVVLIGALLAFAPNAPMDFFGRALALTTATRAFLLALFLATSALAHAVGSLGLAVAALVAFAVPAAVCLVLSLPETAGTDGDAAEPALPDLAQGI